MTAGHRSPPTLSVIMSVYNAEAFLAEAIDSLLKQTFTDFELLIIDDGSVDRTRSILQSYSDRRIKLIVNDTNRGLAESLNRALDQARGEYIARADADDVCEPSRFETQMAALEEHREIDLLGSALTVMDERGRYLGRRDYPLRHDQIVRSMSLFNPLAHPSVMWRVRGGPRLQFRYRNHIVEDYDLWSRLARQGAVFGNLAEPLVRYRIHMSALKWAKLHASLRGTLEVKRTYWMQQMGLRGRLRMLGERMLLFMPPRLVMGLFLQQNVKKIFAPGGI